MMKQQRKHTGATGSCIAVARSAAVLALAVLASGAAAFADTIELATGQRHEGVTITRAKWNSVGFSLGAVDQAVEGFKVVAIERSGRANLSRVLVAIQSGQFAEAASQLDTAKKAGISQDWEKAFAAYLEGRLYLEWASEDDAKAKEAITAYTAFLKEFESSEDFYLPFATYDLGNAYLAAGQPKSSVKWFQDLEKFGGDRGIWGYRSKIGQALAILAEGNRSKMLEARRLFNAVKNDSRAPDGVKEEAAVGYAASFNVSGDHDKAIDEVTRAFLKKNGNVQYTENYGKACNVMGDAYKQQNKLQEAEIWYLRTTCFFKKYPGVYRTAAMNLIDIYTKTQQKDRAQEWQERLK